MKKSVEEYMSLPYTKIIREIEDEGDHFFYGRIMELDGCQSTGDTLDELYENLKEAMEGYLEVKLENDLPIPEPSLAENYSGRFVLRIPKTLHKRLALEAKEEGVSLNQYALYKLAK